MNATEPVRASRGGKKPTRSKSGCRTCKIRRIKCDEGRPGCLRCSSTGRVCDGYGIWDSKLRLPSTTGSLYQPISPSCLFSRNKSTLSSFAWFTTRARKKIPGIFASDFWNTLILQVSAQETAVLHSLVALASAHKRGMLSPHDGLSESGVPDNESFMLQHYNAAIMQLRHHLTVGDKKSVRVVAISCLIFICLEFLRGNMKTGANHLQNGLNLLPLLNSQSDVEKGTLVLKAHNESVEDAVTEAFLRLYVYSASFHRFPQKLSILAQDSAFDRQTHAFATIGVARQHLDELVNRVYRLESDVRHLQTIRHPITNTMLQEQRHIQKDLDCWLRLYKHSYAKLVNDSSAESLPLTLLHIHHTMANVMAGTCLTPADELSYDLFNSSFASIVILAQHLLGAAASVMAADISSGACTEKFSFSADMGIILPLYYIILKSRCPKIRRRALKLLIPVSHQEGIWNGPLASSIACRVIEIEEGGFYRCSPFEEWPLNTCKDAPIPTLPESHRISDVYMEPFDNSTKDITWVYKRMQGNGDCLTFQESVRYHDIGRSMLSATGWF
ncbi:uncharacterized protein BKA55DRAFT_579225 [Fusarium redolens]|uniref:Zn(2)-C6 fungal-type domain-containing protein n=1 Tax=Fusarium redolens TaxID=48865 RepID=A0A9P9GBE0_FUSRE|nr:uncharacterized protein BKA55DRAFT_579225 [Fusarium redolens]KAH7234637.1 hypothetical protein BKA55DRAFT_579225 [Fusarium redolens]